MRTRVIKTFIKEVIREAKIGAGTDYAEKEDLRKKLQNCLQDDIASGRIGSDKELVEWWKTLEMARQALQGVPFSAWKRISER